MSLPVRDKVNSLFGFYKVETTGDVEFIDDNEFDSNALDYIYRNTGLQNDIVQADNRFNAKFDKPKYLDEKNKAYLKDVVEPLKAFFKMSFIEYLNLGNSQTEALKKANADLEKYRIILEGKFKQKFPYSTNSVINKL